MARTHHKMQYNDTTVEALRATPIAGVGVMTLFGVPLSDLVLIGTAVYTLFLLIDKFPTVLRRLVQAYRWLKGKYGREQ